MKPPFMRTPFNYDRDEASGETGLVCPEPTLAQQQFKEEADINTILERFGRTGELVVPVRMPQFGDFEQVNDYHSAMNAVRTAQESFDALPAKVRARFNNDPEKFVLACQDESMRDELVALGLVEPVMNPAQPDSQPPAAA